MASEPWFKLFAADYLLDAGVDSLPLEAQAVLPRMWCLCHLEGSCPSNPEEIARKTRLPSEAIARYYEQLIHFFELRDGRLYSRRMEKERAKSAAARETANRRWHRGDAECNAKRNAECDAQSQSQSQSQSQDQSQIQNPPPSKESGFVHSKEKNYSQTDFDEEAYRLFAKAGRELELKLANGLEMSAEEVFRYQSAKAGKTPQRMSEILARMEGASA